MKEKKTYTLLDKEVPVPNPMFYRRRKFLSRVHSVSLEKKSKSLFVYLQPDFVRALKLLSAFSDTTITDLVQTALINQYGIEINTILKHFEEHGKK